MTSVGDPEGMTADAAPGDTTGRRRGHRSPVFRVIAGTLAVLFFVSFVALGTWQVKRRIWKLDLIARVEERVHAPPAASPGPAEWPNVTAAADEYRHVTATGTFLDDSQTLVQAVTDLGAGYWVMTPLRLADGSIVLVNRGFVRADDHDRVQPGATAQPTSTVQSAATATVPPAATATVPPAATPTVPPAATPTVPPAATATVPPTATPTVTGLLRMTEPRGGFLRHNDPVANRWYSRDVQAIAAARGLTGVAPYFIDAEATASGNTTGRAQSDGSGPSAAAVGGPPAPASHAGAVTPVEGLTVITFRNSHLVYAITWYTLALMVAGAIWLGIRSETRT